MYTLQRSLFIGAVDRQFDARLIVASPTHIHAYVRITLCTRPRANTVDLGSISQMCDERRDEVLTASVVHGRYELL